MDSNFFNRVLNNHKKPLVSGCFGITPNLASAFSLQMKRTAWGEPVGENHITRAWDNIATKLSMLYDDLELHSYPEGLNRFMSDHIPFYFLEIPVVMFSGMYQQSDGTFSARPFMFQWAYCDDGNLYARLMEEEHEDNFVIHSGLLHSQNDCVHFISENWPGKMERAMWGYAIFLEAMLLQQYY